MNKLQSNMRSGEGAAPRGRADLAREAGRAAVVEAARNLVNTKGAIAFMNQDKAIAWAELQVAIDALDLP